MRGDAQVFHEVVDTADPDGQRDAESHRHDDQQRIDRPRNPHLHIVVEHVADEIDQRHAGDDKQGTGEQRMPRRVGMEHAPQRSRPLGRREECRGPCQQRGDESGGRDIHIMVGTQLVEHGPHTESQNGGYRSVEKGRPVATELDAETAAGEPGPDRHLPRRIVTLAGTDIFQLLFVSFERIILADRPPGEFADRRDGSHVDAVLLATLELGKRVLLVPQIDHQHVVIDVDVQVFFRQAQISGRAFHVAHDAARVRGAFHQQFARPEQQVELAVQKFFGILLRNLHRHLFLFRSKVRRPVQAPVSGKAGGHERYTGAPPPPACLSFCKTENQMSSLRPRLIHERRTAFDERQVF